MNHDSNPSAVPPSANRRRMLKLAAATLAAQATAGYGGQTRADSTGAPDNAALRAALAQFSALSATGTSYFIHADVPNAAWHVSSNADRPLFIGSAVKTFILAQYLIDAETGRNGAAPDGSQTATVNDAVRTPDSPVLMNLSGTLPFTSVLEAMIAHSDNIATDITLAQVTAARVRQLIARAGLTQTRIPDSTRRLFSYLTGAPAGHDDGWRGIMQALQHPSHPRPAVNDQESMLSTAAEMVNWYRQALSGKFFSQAQTLRTFKYIQSMANAIPLVVPSGIAAYAKGGSIDWRDFHAICVAGQMIVDQTPVTFCFIDNWTKDVEADAAGTQAFLETVGAALGACVDVVRQSRP